MKITEVTATTDYRSDAISVQAGGGSKPKFRDQFLRANREASVQSAAASAGGAKAAAGQYVIKRGDTMSAIARQWIEQSGADVSTGAISRAVGLLVRVNGIENPDVIHPGKLLSLPGRSADAPLTATMQGGAATEARDQKQVEKAASSEAANPVTEKMLSRAVSLHYVEASQIHAVRQKFMDLAQSYRIRPDDLARVMLMESDGMNPKATNGSCHGVIQFCEGENRGAASVGYGKNPKAILNLGVLEQLDLVRRYFDETGLKNIAPASLDDVYLTVLKPAARAQRNPDANLEIPGAQALALYPGNDRSQPITRNSLLAGLYRTAREKLAVSKGEALSLNDSGLAGKAISRRESGLKVYEANGGQSSL